MYLEVLYGETWKMYLEVIGQREKRYLLGSFLLLLLAAGFSLLLGNDMVSTGALLKALTGCGTDRAVKMILLQVRLPRLAAGIICGMGLSVSGLLLQTSLDNELASPGIMGINAGAGLCVLIAGIAAPFSAIVRQAAGFTGAVLAILLVCMVCQAAGFARAVLVLTGVAVSSLFTAAANAVITIFPGAVADKTAFSLGSLSSVTWEQAWTSGIVTAIGIAAALLHAGQISLLKLGDETAAGLGISPQNVRKGTVLLAALLAGAAVSLCGLLGFVGLIIPNLVRRLSFHSLPAEILACALSGSAFLILCDLLSRHLFFPYELPVGVLLSFLGAPFFLSILIRRKRSVELS